MQLLTSLTWRDLLDILILTLLAYPIYASLRGTAAVRILAGVVFLGLLSVAAEELGLVLTTWVLRGVGAVAILLLIVVFHEELRGALLAASPLRWFRGQRGVAERDELDVMARCYLDLAARRVGGIFVYPRLEPLDPHLTSGTFLGGRFSPEVVDGLLHHSSPVHDGALVIEGDQIVRVGCFLPLSTRTDLNVQFGTRHRAAAGLSEKTDALVVVVSEERGEASVAEKGNVARVQTFEELRDCLRKGLPQKDGAKRSRFPIVRDLPGKILVLCIVVAFWALVTDRGERLFMVLTVPLIFRGVPDRYELVHPSPERVQLKVRGSRRLLQGLGTKGASVTVDLDGVGRGRIRLPIEPRDVGLAPGIDIVDITPPFATVDLEERLVKQVPLKADLEGPLAPGISEVRATLDPPKVWLEGAANELNTIQAVLTQTIRRDEVVTAQSREVRIVMPAEGVRLKEGEPSTVTVHLDVVKSAASAASPSPPPAPASPSVTRGRSG